MSDNEKEMDSVHQLIMNDYPASEYLRNIAALQLEKQKLREENKRLYEELLEARKIARGMVGYTVKMTVNQNVTYCQHCGHIGKIGETRPCCPDCSLIIVHPEVAKQAKAGFKALYLT